MEETLALRLIGKKPIKSGNLMESLAENIVLEKKAVGEPGKGDVVLEPLFVGICGSDLSASQAKPNFDWVERPRTIGHEFSARIAAFGPDTEGWGGYETGDLVTVVAMRGCGDPRCPGCRRGMPNYCRRKQIMGFHREGAMAGKIIVEVERLMPLRHDLTPVQGSLIEPLSVVTQAIYRKSRIKPGMDVVVSGCGIIGLLSAELARLSGARVAVTGLERDREHRLTLAEKRGFDTVIVSEDKPLYEQLAAGIQDREGRKFGDEYEEGRVDVLIECSGAPAALAAAGRSVRFEGTISVIATYPKEVPFEATDFVRAGQTMTSTMGSSREDFEKAQILLRNGLFPVEDYVQVYPFEKAVEAIADSIRGLTSKAVLEMSG